MSLIQVSSTQKLLNQQSLGTGTFNKGYDFTNYFASNLNIPENCEIALHNAIFTMENEQNINFANVNLTAGGNLANMAYVSERTIGDYAFMSNNIESLDTGSAPLHYPLTLYVKSKKYPNIASFWDEMVQIINTDPRPENHFREAITALGILATGLDYTYSSFGGTPTITFVRARNGCNSLLREGIAAEVRSGWRQLSPNPLDIITLENFGTLPGFPYQTSQDLEKTTLNSTQKTRPAIYTTQHSGINTSGGLVRCRSMSSVAVSNTDGSISRISRHQFGFGCRAWADPNFSGTDDMYLIAKDFDYLAEYNGDPNMLSYKFMDEIFNGGYDTLVNYPQITGMTKQQAAYIFKYETGGNFNEGAVYTGPRWICIATGDPNVSIRFNIPYSENLDPDVVGSTVGNPYQFQGNTGFLIENDIPSGPTKAGIQPSWNFVGNVAFPNLNTRPIYIAKSPASLNADPATNSVILSIQFQDRVYPLQSYFVITGGKRLILSSGDKFKRVDYNPITWKDQKKVNYFGNTQDDFFKYSGSKQILPAAIYNMWQYLQTPNCFYPLEPDLVSPAPEPQATAAPIDILSGSAPIDHIEMEDWLISGHTQLYAPYENVNYNYYPNIPNISKEIGLDDTANNLIKLDVVDPATYVDLKGDYIPNEPISPFLLGLYIRLKNLPNRAIMGSINQTSDKLVAIVNRYDNTNIGSSVYPTFSYNEYEKIYVNLNNPSPLNINELDIEIVDKFGNPVKALRETMLSFHLRPTSYKWEF